MILLMPNYRTSGVKWFPSPVGDVGFKFMNASMKMMIALHSGFRPLSGMLVLNGRRNDKTH